MGVGKDRVEKYSVAVIQPVVGVVFNVNVKSFYRVEVRALLMVTEYLHRVVDSTEGMGMFIKMVRKSGSVAVL
jgi:hypothetical protein